MENKGIRKWNMLDSYSEGQAIYGRDTEIAQVSESIIENVQTFIYGKSGIGKTSLIQAGVFPELRRNGLFPVIIRLAFYENEDLKKVVIRRISEEAEREYPQFGKPSLSLEPIDDSDLSECSLCEFFSKMSFTDCSGKPYIPVLIFDQFEETINNEKNWQRTVDFITEELYDLLDNSIAVKGRTLDYTNYRIVFSMREDYLYCLEDIIDRFSLWELRYNRFRIKSLSDDNAYEVIRRTSGPEGLEPGMEDRIIKAIIKIVKMNSGSRFTEINTALLSLICSLLSENAAYGCIMYDDLRKINSYLESYYDWICELVGEKATRYLESCLLTKDGRRSSVDEAEALMSKKINKNQLDHLVDLKLLRRIKIDGSSIRYEYIHDLFAKMVFKRRKKKNLLMPQYQYLSKSISLSVFLKKVIITSIPILVFGFLFEWYHEWNVHGNKSFDLLEILRYRCCVPIYMTVVALVIYLLPFFVQRYHKSNHSGWLLLLFPVASFLAFIEKFFPLFEGVKLFIHPIAYLLIVYAVGALLINRKSGSYKPGYSAEYESIYKLTPISNYEYFKGLSVECLLFLSACFMVDICHFVTTDNIVWRFTPTVKVTFLNNPIYPFVYFLIFFPCFSQSLRSRLKGIGYDPSLSYFPLLNWVLAIECLFSDKTLKTLRLYKGNRIQYKSPVEFLESELETISTVKRKRDDVIDQLMIKCVLIPFYGLIYMFNKRRSLEVRINAARAVGLHSSLLCFVSFFLMISYESDIYEYINIFFTVLLYCCLTYVVYLNYLYRKLLLDTIKKNPRASEKQIAGYFVKDRTKWVNRRINKFIKKGVLSRIEQDGDMVWIINEKIGKSKFKKQN